MMRPVPDPSRFSCAMSFDAAGVQCPVCSSKLERVDVDEPGYEPGPDELIRWSFSCGCELAYRPLGYALVEVWLSADSFDKDCPDLVRMNRVTVTAVVPRRKTESEAGRGITYIIRRRPEPAAV